MVEIEELYHDLFNLMEEQCILDTNEILKLQLEDGGRRIRCFVNGGFEVPDLARIAEHFGDEHMAVYGHENGVQELVISNDIVKGADTPRKRKVVKGIAGIMELFKVGQATAQRYKDGILAPAVQQAGRGCSSPISTTTTASTSRAMTRTACL